MSILQERIKSKRLSTGLTLSEVADLIGVKEATMQRCLLYTSDAADEL